MTETSVGFAEWESAVTLTVWLQQSRGTKTSGEEHSKGAEEGGPVSIDGSFGDICHKQMQGHELVAGGGHGVKEMSFQTGCPTMCLDAGGKTSQRDGDGTEEREKV